MIKRYNMSTIKCLSVVAFTVTLAVVLIVCSCISSFGNKVRLLYASPAKLDNTLSDRSNKVVMINFDAKVR